MDYASQNLAKECMLVDMEVQSRLNVLISSSRQWNPGDEFILRGVRCLLESRLGNSLNYILWNRNPDLFVDRWRDSHFRADFLTNSALEPSLDLIDLVVLAGTPEWFGRPVERVFRELLRFPNVPLLAIGVGSGGPGFVFNSLEREVFQRENSLLICRNPTLAQEINEQISPNHASVLPCPALFCSQAETPRPVGSFASGFPTVNLQSDCVENQSAPADFVQRLIRFMDEHRDRPSVRFVAHYIDEFVRFSKRYRNADIFFSYEPLDYIRFYREEPRALVTSRLHGAIASLSCGTPACLVDFGSERLIDAAKPFGDLLPCLPLDDAIAWLNQQSPEQCAHASHQFLSFKKSIFDRYSQSLAKFLDRHVTAERRRVHRDDAA